MPTLHVCPEIALSRYPCLRVPPSRRLRVDNVTSKQTYMRNQPRRFELKATHEIDLDHKNLALPSHATPRLAGPRHATPRLAGPRPTLPCLVTLSPPHPRSSSALPSSASPLRDDPTRRVRTFRTDHPSRVENHRSQSAGHPR